MSSPKDTVTNLLKLFESMDIGGFLVCLTDDASYRFGNYPAAVGKEATHIPLFKSR